MVWIAPFLNVFLSCVMRVELEMHNKSAKCIILRLQTWCTQWFSCPSVNWIMMLGIVANFICIVFAFKHHERLSYRSVFWLHLRPFTDFINFRYLSSMCWVCGCGFFLFFFYIKLFTKFIWKCYSAGCIGKNWKPHGFWGMLHGALNDRTKVMHFKAVKQWLN